MKSYMLNLIIQLYVYIYIHKMYILSFIVFSCNFYWRKTCTWPGPHFSKRDVQLRQSVQWIMWVMRVPKNGVVYNGTSYEKEGFWGPGTPILGNHPTWLLTGLKEGREKKLLSTGFRT